MLLTILALLAFQCVGDEIASVASLPVPGMVIGTILLFSALGLRKWKLGNDRAVPVALERLANHLHGNLGLLFVPAGVGVTANINVVQRDGLVLIFVVVISTAITIIVTSTVVAWRPRAAAVTKSVGVQ
jgi:holin-like protein